MTDTPVKRERTCIGCGEKASKTKLYRLVRLQDGSVRFDPSGRAAGRGAYVCSLACFQAAAKGRLQKALRCAVNAEDAASAAEELERALAGASAR